MEYKTLENWKSNCKSLELFILKPNGYSDLENDNVWSSFCKGEQLGFFNVDKNYGLLFKTEKQLSDYCYKNNIS